MCVCPFVCVSHFCLSPEGQTFLTHRRGGTNIFHTQGGTNIFHTQERKGEQTFFTHRRGGTNIFAFDTNYTSIQSHKMLNVDAVSAYIFLSQGKNKMLTRKKLYLPITIDYLNLTSLPC